MKPKVSNRLIAGLLAGRNLMGLGSLMLTCSFAQAANLYWDANGALAGSGNAGALWEGSNWSTDSTGSILTGPWADGNSAVFSAGTDGTGDWTVTLGSTVTVASILFEETANTRNINGGTINIGGGTIDSTVNGTGEPGGNNGRDVNMNSLLAGSGGLTIAAHGNHVNNGGGGQGSEFRLGNAGNSFSGGLTITNGLVSFSVDGNLGATSNVITLNGGGLLYTSEPVLTLSRSIQVGANGGAIRLYGGKNVYFTGTMTNVIGTTPTFRRTDGGTFRVYGSMSGYNGTFLNGGGETYFPVANVDLSNTDLQSEGGAISMNGGGTAVVNKITSGNDFNIEFGTVVNVDTGNIVLTGGGNYRSNMGAPGKLTSSSGTLTFASGAASGNLSTGNPQIHVEIADFGATPVSLVKTNVGNLILNKQNTYTGTTTVNAGRIDLKHPVGFSAGAVTVNSGGQVFLTCSDPVTNNLTINGNGPTETTSFGALRLASPAVFAGTLNVASAARVGADTNNVGTISGPLTGSAALSKTGAGTVVLTGDTSGYSGAITVNAGTLNISTTHSGSVTAVDGALVAGEGTVGTLTLGATAGAGILINPSNSDALKTTNLTLNGVNTVRLTTTPSAGTPVDVIKYTGTLTMTGTADDRFALLSETQYRTLPTFADTGSAITMTLPAGANLLWVGNVDGNWNLNNTSNWLNGAASDKFYTGDNVTFDDTGLQKTVTMSGMLSPATVTFNNSTGNDYTIAPNGGGFGFTGPTNIVKNGTGTVRIQGYSHNYTGTVTINAGVLQGDGNYEVLGNASAVTINAGGQLNINGLNLGNGSRHYNVTIAGNGPDGSGAINNTSNNNPNENAGILNLTLSADASVGTTGTTGGRYDIGRSGASFGSLNGNGFTLTKVGSATICMRAPATNLTYAVSAGTLKFEDYNTATGSNAIAVNGGTLQSWGPRTFANTLNFAAGTTLDNDGGGGQVWSGPINLTGAAGSNVNVSARNGVIELSGPISGASDLTINANNITYLTGSASNTNTGTTKITSTGQLILAKSGGAVAFGGDLTLAPTATRAIVSTLQNNQFGTSSVLRYAANGDGRLELKGTTQTVAGIDNSAATPGYNCIQHSEFGTPPAVDGVSDLIVNVADTMFYTFNGVLRDTGGLVNLVKSGLGTQALLGGGIDFRGTTNVTAGRLILNSDDSWTSALNISPGAVCEVNITNTGEPYENRYVGFTLTGGGTYVKTGPGTMSMGWGDGTPTIMATVAMDPDASIEIGEGTMRFDYGRQTSWTNNKSDMFISSGATLDLWDNNNDGIIVDSLNGSGSIIRSNYGQTGNLTVGVDNGDETPAYFSGVISNASGKTNLIKKGTGTQILAGVNTYTGNTMVDDGILELAGTGSLKFAVTDATSNMITGAGTATLDGSFNIDTTAVTVTTGVWTLVDVGILDPASTFGETFTLGAGWTEVSGVWTKIEGNNKWTFTESTGELELTPNNTYGSWINSFFTGVTDPAIIGGAADPDNDGIDNAVEMVLGGNPATGMDAALLPTIEMVTDPATLPTGEYLLFTYRRTDLSVGAGLVAACEYDADLAGTWSLAQDGVNGVEIMEDDNYTFVPASPNTDRVRVFVPLGANPELFGHLRVTVP